MTMRQRLPNRRRCESFEFRHAGLDFTATVGFHWDGRIAEIFLSSAKPGTAIEATARDAAITVSIALRSAPTSKRSGKHLPAIMTADRQRCSAPRSTSSRSAARHDRTG
jgi:hypothetical protein